MEVKFDVSRSQLAITDDSQEVLPASQKSEASEEVETALARDFDPLFSVHTSDYSQSLSDVIDSESDDSTLSTERTNSTNVSKFIVFNDCLQELFQFCPVCGSPVVSHTQFCTGTLLTVNIICSKGHERQWRSQPSIAGMHAGNLMVSAAILFSGETYSKISHFAEILKLQFLSESAYYRIQNEYVSQLQMMPGRNIKKKF